MPRCINGEVNLTRELRRLIGADSVGFWEYSDIDDTHGNATANPHCSTMISSITGTLLLPAGMPRSGCMDGEVNSTKQVKRAFYSVEAHGFWEYPDVDGLYCIFLPRQPECHVQFSLTVNSINRRSQKGVYWSERLLGISRHSQHGTTTTNPN